MQLAKLGVKRILVCGTLLAGGSYFILGCVLLNRKMWRKLLMYSICTILIHLQFHWLFASWCLFCVLWPAASSDPRYWLCHGINLRKCASDITISKPLRNCYGQFVSMFLSKCIEDICVQGLMELAGGVGYTIGPVIGGVLYEVM